MMVHQASRVDLRMGVIVKYGGYHEGFCEFGGNNPFEFACSLLNLWKGQNVICVTCDFVVEMSLFLMELGSLEPCEI